MKQPPISNLDWYCKVHCKTKLSAVILYLKDNCSGRNRTISIMPDL